MKKLFKLFTIFAMAVCLTLLCGCDLSHKHFQDGYGYCASCETDTCEVLTRGIYNKYTSVEKTVGEQYQQDSFYKFVSNGEQGIKIEVLGVERGSYSVLFYSRQTSSFYLEPSAEGAWYCHNDLTKGTTYYIKITFRQQGKASILVRDLAFVVEE